MQLSTRKMQKTGVNMSPTVQIFLVAYRVYTPQQYLPSLPDLKTLPSPVNRNNEVHHVNGLCIFVDGGTRLLMLSN